MNLIGILSSQPSVQWAFDGSARNIVLGALAAQPASREEVVEIRRMLDEFGKPKGRSR